MFETITMMDRKSNSLRKPLHEELRKTDGEAFGRQF